MNEYGFPEIGDLVRYEGALWEIIKVWERMKSPSHSFDLRRVAGPGPDNYAWKVYAWKFEQLTEMEALAWAEN